MEQQPTVFGPLMKKVALESHSVFSAVQKRAFDQRSGGRNERIAIEECIQYSRHYRALLRSNALSAGESDVDDEAKLLFTGELLWHLFEIFCLEHSPTSLPLPALIVEWYHWHWVEPTWEGGMSDDISEDPEQFWRLVIHLTLQGRVHQAADLLALHPSYTRGFGSDEGDGSSVSVSSWIQSTVKLLEGTPIRSAASITSSSATFAQHLTIWQNSAHSLLTTLEGAAVSYKSEERVKDGLCAILSVVCGRFDIMSKFADTWYELLIGDLIYCYPNTLKRDMKNRVEECLSKMKMDANTSAIDKTLLALLQNDTLSALAVANTTIKGDWIGAHLSDLLMHAGELRQYFADASSSSSHTHTHKSRYHIPPIEQIQQTKRDSEAEKLRDSYIIDYTRTLVGTDATLWMTAVNYTRYCLLGGMGRERGMEIIRNVDVSDANMAENVTKICGIFMPPLNDVANEKSIEYARKCSKNNSIGQAVKWYLRAGDSDSVAELAHDLLAEAIENGTHEALDTLADSLSSITGNGALLIRRNKALAFIPVYREFQSSLARGVPSPISNISKLLVSLVTPDSEYAAPYKFVPTILIDAMPLLEHETVIVNSEETLAIIEAMESLMSSHRVDEWFGGVSLDEVNAIRLALSRNLARATVAEGLDPEL